LGAGYAARAGRRAPGPVTVHRSGTADLLARFPQHYPDIAADDEVTVVHFRVLLQDPWLRDVVIPARLNWRADRDAQPGRLGR